MSDTKMISVELLESAIININNAKKAGNFVFAEIAIEQMRAAIKELEKADNEE